MDVQFSECVDSLNPQQRRIYVTITEAIEHSVDHAIKKCDCETFKPLYLYVSGFGGTGKSYLIKAIMAWAYVQTNTFKQNCKIVLAAPTGISAAGINGMTLHSALSLPIEHHGKLTYNPLTGAKLQQIQAFMRNVHCVIIDEISMVSNVTLLHIHLRLTEIFGRKYGNNNFFGSQTVVVLGDLLQLPPVKGDEVFINLSEKQVKETTGMMSTDLSLWSHFNYEELTINQRQKNDNNAEFKDCLKRIRIGIVLDGDVRLLLSRKIDVCKENPMESLVTFYNDLAKDGEFPVCLLPTRSMVREFNDAVLASRSSSKIEEIPAIDDIQCNFPRMKVNAQERLAKLDLDDRNTAGLENRLRLSVGTRVMLRRNIDTGKKLVNGSTGIINKFKCNQGGQVHQIVIQFDEIADPVELNRDKRKIRIFEHAYVYREQFPLTCAYSITIHKSQGLSLKCVMADLGDSIFSEGQIYVALSRVQTLSGLHLININFNKIKASPKALSFYASKSTQKYDSEKQRENISHSEATWYTVSKRKKQAELIKGVVDKEIKDVPGRYFSRNKTNIDARPATKPHISKHRKTKQPPIETYLLDNILATGSEVQDNQSVNIISTFSTFKNPINACWFNSVLQVIIHALKQHEENMLDVVLDKENEYVIPFLNMLKRFSIPGKKYCVDDRMETEISVRHLMLKAMDIDLTELTEQQDASSCIQSLVDKIPQLDFLKHDIRDYLDCNV